MANHGHGNRPKGSFELFNPSIEAVRLNLWAFFWLAFVPALLFVGSSYSGPDNAQQPTATSDITTAEAVAFGGTAFVLVVVGLLLALIIAPALIHLEIQSARGKKVGVSDALKVGMQYLLRYLGLMILYGLLTVGGLILLIIPGLIMIRRYFLAPYYLIDQDLSIREAMKRSADDSKPYSGSVWGIIGVNILLSVPSFIPVVGAFVSMVLTTFYSVAPALRYDELRSFSGDDKPAA